MWAPLHRRRVCSGLHRVLVISAFRDQSSSGIRSLLQRSWLGGVFGFCFLFTQFQSVGCPCRVEGTSSIVLVSQRRDFWRETVLQRVLKMLRLWICLISSLKTAVQPAPLDRESFVSGSHVLHPELCDLHFPSGAQLSR